MRKVLAVVAVLALLAFVVLLAVVVVVPLLYGQKAVDAALAQANETLDATIEVQDTSLGFLRTFPDVAVGLEGLRVVNEAPFDGVELLKAGELRVVVSLVSLLGDGPPTVKEIALTDATVHLVIDEDGRMNTDIAPPSDEGAAGEEEPSEYRLKLDHIAVTDLDLLYDDRPGGLFVELTDLDHEGEGDVGSDVIRFDTRTEIGSLSLKQGGVGLLKDTHWVADVEVALDQASGALTFEESAVSVNELRLGFAGTVAPQERGTDLDLSVRALETSFRGLLSLVPDAYTASFADVKTDGTLALQATVKGLLPAEGDDLPAFDLAMQVRDARFQYPDLPTAVEGIALDLAAHHAGGDPDGVEVDLDRFAFTAGGSPFQGKLKLRHPISDPDVDAQVKGRLDLGLLDQVLPQPGVKTSGTVDVDLDLAGRMSQFDAGRFGDVRARGYVRMADVVYEDATQPVPFYVDKLDMSVAPQAAEVSALHVRFGKSDLRGTGRFDNYLDYAISDGKLVGRLDLESSVIDLAPFTAEEAEAQPAAGQEPTEIIVVPTDLDIEVEGSFRKVLYDDLELGDVKARLVVREGAVQMERMAFTLLDGRVAMSGRYSAPTAKTADVDLQVDMVDFHVGRTATAIETLGRIAPIAKKADGRFNTNFRMQGRLLQNFTPDLLSLFSSGRVRTSGLRLQPDFMGRVSDKTGNGAFKTLDLDGADFPFEISGGKLRLDEVKVKVGGGEGRLSGKTGVMDESLDLELDLSVPVGSVKAADLLSQLGAGDKGKAKIRVLVGGTYTDPKVKIDLSGVEAAAADLVQEQVGARVDDLIAAAREQGDKLVAEAEKAAARLLDEARAAGDALRDKARKEGKKLKKEAKGNPIKEAAAEEAAKKLDKEADKAARKLEKEAKDKGDGLVRTARAKRDQLIADAEKKTGR